MKIPIYQVDAFTDTLFGGNPAAVCILEKGLDEKVMQAIAAENNLAETAFVVPKGNDFEIRWFTPESEVDLCGHATLASAHVLFRHMHFDRDKIGFYSPHSAWLYVSKDEDRLHLDFPQDGLSPIVTPALLVEAFGQTPIECYQGKSDYLLIFETQKQIENFKPNLNVIAQAGNRGVIVSAKGDKVDFVSRFFAPQIGIPEDPVTGSAHTSLTPFWAKKLGKNQMTALQLSKRGGQLNCELQGDRVLISGKAITYLVGEIKIPDEKI